MLGEESPAEQSAFCGDQSESYNAITWRFSAAQWQLRTSDQPTLHSSTRCGDRNAPAPEPITKTKHQERGRQSEISRNTHTLNKYPLLSKMTIILTYSRSPKFKKFIFLKSSIKMANWENFDTCNCNEDLQFIVEALNNKLNESRQGGTNVPPNF